VTRHGEPIVMDRWVDLAAAGVTWAEGLNFNGIVLTPDRRHLVACQTNTGRLWRIDLATEEPARWRWTAGRSSTASRQRPQCECRRRLG
jgi:sugar lactone lactonase YvrE